MYKKASIVILIMIFFSSCIAYKAPAIQIGMSVEEFKENATNPELVSMDKEWTVYKVLYKYGYTTGYYYFRNGKLVRMDSEDDKEDYKIKIEKD